MLVSWMWSLTANTGNSATSLNLNLGAFSLHSPIKRPGVRCIQFCVGSRVCAHMKVETWIHNLLVRFLKPYKRIVHPSIHPLSTIYIRSDTWWPQAKRGRPDVLLPSHMLLLILGDREAYPGQMAYNPSSMFWVCPGSPRSWTCLEFLHVRKASYSDVWTTSTATATWTWISSGKWMDVPGIRTAS